MSEQIELTVVVNGQPTEVEANLHEDLGSIIPRALQQTGNAGQPPENWELRNAEGKILPLDRKIDSFHFPRMTKLFLNLRAGIGGQTRLH
ncbi:MAG: DUF2604 domain-containing protein [Candidatus Dormibacteria bacterium]